MLNRGMAVGILLFCCAITAAEQRAKEPVRQLTVGYEFEFATLGIEAVKVQLKVTGPISKPLHTTLTGIGDYHVEIETTEIPGDEPQYQTKWHVTERDVRGCITNIVARPQIRSFGNIPACLEISDGKGEDRKFQATVYNLK